MCGACFLRYSVAALLSIPQNEQAKLASQMRSRKQKRFPPAQHASSERNFVGGGYRINSSVGGGGGGGAGSRRSAGTASPNQYVGGEGAFAGNNLEATRSSSCSALPTAPAGVLDLEAINTAAGRLNGSTGGGRGGSGVHLENLAQHHPRNRFAPMAEGEVERFLLQSWKNGYVFAGLGDDDSGGKGGGDWGDSMGCDAGKAAVSSLLTGIGSSPASKQLHVVGTSTRCKEGRAPKAGSTSAREVAPSSPRASTVLEGWTTIFAPTTETER